MRYRTALLLFLLALVPRILYLVDARQLPLFEELYLDARSYDQWGERVAGGEWIGERAFPMAPLYPYALGALYKTFGHNLLLVRVLQHLIGAATAVLLFALARRLFGVGAAIFAYLLFLGYGPFLYFEGQVLVSSLGVAFGVASLFLLIRASERGGRGLFAAGLVLGIGSVARPNLLFFLPFALLWLLAREKVGARIAARYLVGFLIALVPPTVHNYHVSKEIIPISSHGGISFYLGNNPYTWGAYVPPPQFGGTPEAIDITDSRRLAEEALGRSLGAGEISNYWYNKSFEWIRQNKADFVSLLLRKIALYANAFEIPLDVNYEFDKKLTWMLRRAPFSFGFLLPLAAVGLVRLFRRGGRGWLLVLFVAANAISVIAFFICARYRQTAVPALVILAGYAVASMGEEWVRRRWKGLALSAGAFLLFALPVNANLYPGKNVSEARSLVILGRAYAETGDRAKAEESFRRALAVHPMHVDAHMNLGMLYYDAGRYHEAADAFLAAAEGAPRFAGAWNNWGNALRQAGRPEEAVEAIRQAIRLDPGYAGAHNNLGYTLASLGRHEEAEAAYREAIRLEPQSVHSWANLADLLPRMGKPGEAVELMNEAARLHQGNEAVRWKRDQVMAAADEMAAQRGGGDE